MTDRREKHIPYEILMEAADLPWGATLHAMELSGDGLTIEYSVDETETDD